MKLEEMNLKLAEGILNWWTNTGDSRIDELKNPDVMYDWMFTAEVKPLLYMIPGLLVIVTGIIPGKSALIYELGLLNGEYDVKEAKQLMINIVREFDLKRLTFMSPSCVNQFSPALKAIGFKYEGRLKFSATYNGKLADMDLYGFYSVKPKNRRRRGRRNGRQESTVQISNGTSNLGGESQDSVHGQEVRSASSEG